jgi:hypothetical protein
MIWLVNSMDLKSDKRPDKSFCIAIAPSSPENIRLHTLRFRRRFYDYHVGQMLAKLAVENWSLEKPVPTHHGHLRAHSMSKIRCLYPLVDYPRKLTQPFLSLLTYILKTRRVSRIPRLWYRKQMPLSVTMNIKSELSQLSRPQKGANYTVFQEHWLLWYVQNQIVFPSKVIFWVIILKYGPSGFVWYSFCFASTTFDHSN